MCGEMGLTRESYELERGSSGVGGVESLHAMEWRHDRWTNLSSLSFSSETVAPVKVRPVNGMTASFVDSVRKM